MRYRKEIEDLKTRLAECKVEVPVQDRRLSAHEVSNFLIFNERAFFATKYMTGREWKMVTTEKGPNDSRHIIWDLGQLFLFSLVCYELKQL